MRLTVDVSTGLLQIVQAKAKVTGHFEYYHDAFIPLGEVGKFVTGKAALFSAWKLFLDSVMLNKYFFSYLSESVYSLSAIFRGHLDRFFMPTVACTKRIHRL